jgi:hypothetical protein
MTARALRGRADLGQISVVEQDRNQLARFLAEQKHQSGARGVLAAL